MFLLKEESQSKEIHSALVAARDGAVKGSAISVHARAAVMDLSTACVPSNGSRIGTGPHLNSATDPGTEVAGEAIWQVYTQALVTTMRERQ
jgi:hypothetical protein